MDFFSSWSFLQLILIFNIIKITINKSPLILKFDTITSNKLTPDNYFETIFQNEPKVIIKVGTHRQTIPCYLNINTPTTYIGGSNSNLEKSQIKYEEKQSTKYKNISDKETSESFYVYGTPSIDEICLNDEKIIELKFYLARTKFSSNKLSYSCVLGLGYDEFFYDEENNEQYIEALESFILQMKNNNIIKKKLFFISYNSNNDNDDNGEVVFGVFPHDIKENNEKYCEACNEENYVEISNIINEIEVKWSVKGYTYMGEKIIFEYLCSFEFELTQGFIIGSYNYRKNVEEDFFNDKISNNECFQNEIFMQNNAFYGYYCNKNVNITQFKNLILLIDKIQYKIEFNYDDLFTANNGYYYFNVLFPQDEDHFRNDFILGKPFFKKYPMVFNTNGRAEKIGFYQNLLFKKKEKNNETIDENKNANENENENNNGKGNKLIIILIIIGIIIIGLLIYISIKYFKRPRKQKVNELIEFFDYSSVQNVQKNII